MVQEYILNGQKVFLYDWQGDYLKGFFAGKKYGESEITEKSIPIIRKMKADLDFISKKLD